MAEIIIVRLEESNDKIFDKILKVVEKEDFKTINYKKADTLLFNSGLKISLQQKEVFCEGKKISLTSSEFKILIFLSSSSGRVFTKEQIYEAVFNEVDCVNIDNSIYCLIRNLRRKIEPNPKQPKYIHTVRGLGYKLTLD